VSLKDLMLIVERRSFGAAILLLGFIAVSPLTIIPGATWLVAGVTVVVAGQLVAGRRTPLLPPQVTRLCFPRSALVAMCKGAAEMAHVADRLTSPRLEVLTRYPMVIIPGLAAIAAALVTFPLGFFPLAPMLPGLTLVLIGVGLTARDGVFLTLALCTLLGSGLLLLRVVPGLFA
jgi:hypothetical protein